MSIESKSWDFLRYFFLNWSFASKKLLQSFILEGRGQVSHFLTNDIYEWPPNHELSKKVHNKNNFHISQLFFIFIPMNIVA